MKSNTPSATISRPQRSQAPGWQYYAVAIVCCAVLVAGFLLAARQHFSSMEYGLQNSKLRRQLDDLQSAKRRLLLNREVAVSPIDICPPTIACAGTASARAERTDTRATTSDRGTMPKTHRQT